MRGRRFHPEKGTCGRGTVRFSVQSHIDTRKANMHSKLVSRPGETRVWFAALEAGEEVKKAILTLVEREKIAAASFVALGAFEKATIAYFDWDKKEYRPIPVDGQVEVITLVGDVVPDEKNR